MTLDEVKKEILEIWEDSDDEKALHMLLDFLGMDRLNYDFRNALEYYNDKEILEDLLNSWK